MTSCSWEGWEASTLTLPPALVVSITMDTKTLSATKATEVMEGVFLTQLAAGERMSIQHYHIEPGAVVPEHDHHHEQVGFLYEGSLTFVVDGEEIVVSTGESFALESGEPHEVVNRGDDAAKGIDIFSPPRLNPPWE